MTQTPPQRSSLEVLRAKIVEAVPEIMEFAFGVTVKPKNYSDFKWLEKNDTAIVIGLHDVGSKTVRVHWSDGRTSTEREKDLEVIGRPIQLADVLRVMPDYFFVRANGCFWKCDIADKTWTTEVIWDLALPLDDQPQPVIDFLTTILV